MPRLSRAQVTSLSRGAGVWAFVSELQYGDVMKAGEETGVTVPVVAYSAALGVEGTLLC